MKNKDKVNDIVVAILVLLSFICLINILKPNSVLQIKERVDDFKESFKDDTITINRAYIEVPRYTEKKHSTLFEDE